MTEKPDPVLIFLGLVAFIGFLVLVGFGCRLGFIDINELEKRWVGDARH